MMRFLAADGMEGSSSRNGGWLASWSYRRREETESTISSSSGTIVSSPYTCSFSRPSSASMELEAAMQFDFLGFLHEDEDEDDVDAPCPWEETVEKEEHMKSLVQEFFDINSRSMSVLERWLMELGVDWVLQFDEPAGELELDDYLPGYSRSWIRALAQIMQTIRSMASLFPDRGSSLGLPGAGAGTCEEGGGDPEEAEADQFQFARFIQETMLKMLVFVDAMVALHPCEVAELQQKMDILLRVHGALSAASSQLRFSSHSRPPSAQVARIELEITSLFSAKDDEATQAISDTMTGIWYRLMDSILIQIHPPHGSSSDIHNVTRAATDHISYLWDNYTSVAPIVFKAACRGYAAEIGGTKHPLASLTIEKMSCLEEKLDSMSRPFPDQGLRFLFLINNYCYILQQLHDHNTHARNLLHLYFTQLTREIKYHEQRYLQVSWAPMLSCLSDKRYGRSSPLSKFERTFHETYNAQKLWKVPDPVLRERLRKAITKNIVSGYTKYIEDNDVTTLNFSPQDLEEMLQELFEG